MTMSVSMVALESKLNQNMSHSAEMEPVSDGAWLSQRTTADDRVQVSYKKVRQPYSQLLIEMSLILALRVG